MNANRHVCNLDFIRTRGIWTWEQYHKALPGASRESWDALVPLRVKDLPMPLTAAQVGYAKYLMGMRIARWGLCQDAGVFRALQDFPGVEGRAMRKED